MPSGPVAHAWRAVRRSPGALILVVLTLALGIGGATAMFAVVDAVLLNPLPYPNGDRLRELFIEASPGNRNPYLEAVQVDAVLSQTGAFAAVERYGMGAETLTDGDPEMVATRGAPAASIRCACCGRSKREPGARSLQDERLVRREMSAKSSGRPTACLLAIRSWREMNATSMPSSSPASRRAHASPRSTPLMKVMMSI